MQCLTPYGGIWRLSDQHSSGSTKVLCYVFSGCLTNNIFLLMFYLSVFPISRFPTRDFSRNVEVFSFFTLTFQIIYNDFVLK